MKGLTKTADNRRPPPAGEDLPEDLRKKMYATVEEQKVTSSPR